MKTSSSRETKGIFVLLKTVGSSLFGNKNNAAEDIPSPSNKQDDITGGAPIRSEIKYILVDGQPLRVRYNHLPTVESCNC